MKIDYVCERCSYIKPKKQSWTRIPKKIFLSIFIIFLASTSFFGTLGVYNLIIIGYYEEPDMLFTLGGFHAVTTELMGEIKGIEEIETLEKIAQNLTKGCETETCKVIEIYDYIEDNFKYELGTNLNPIEIWNEHEGDCDELSYLMITLLKTQGIKGHLVCNHNHCWAIFKADGNKIVADTTTRRGLKVYV